MGILTERIIAQSPQGFFPPKALAAIEKDVLAVAPHLASQSALVGLTLGTRVIQPQSRPGPVKVLTVRDEQWAGLGYCLKFVQHDSEPNVVLAASRQEAGPRVLSIQENNCYSSILEQFYPQDWNFNVGVQSVGRKDWGTEVATLVIKMFDWQTRRLLIHGDFINDHIFMIPTARGRRIKIN